MAMLAISSAASDSESSILQGKLRAGLNQEDKVCRFNYVQAVLTTPEKISHVAVTSPMLVWEKSIP